ncbi:MAG: uroporphyrinogen-III synthase [Pseudomonadota bacterium]|nr:MAG: uroporphyrinogen-III synthase [Pseudomonadota bacterium]
MPGIEPDGSPPTLPLAGLNILVTRPAHQAEHLCQLIEQAGGGALRFPVIEILPARDTARLETLIDALDGFEIAIFISANAVEHGLALLNARRKLPASLRLAAIGRSTAAALRDSLDREPDICPAERFDSEALLALDEMQEVRGKHIVIFRGEGGREVLAETLRARGATVEYADVYRRACPTADAGVLQGEAIDLITITSGEGLCNLLDMAGATGSAWLREHQLVVLNARLAGIAHELGFVHPAVVAAKASDDALVAAMVSWRAEH